VPCSSPKSSHTRVNFSKFLRLMNSSALALFLSWDQTNCQIATSWLVIKMASLVSLPCPTVSLMKFLTSSQSSSCMVGQEVAAVGTIGGSSILRHIVRISPDPFHNPDLIFYYRHNTSRSARSWSLEAVRISSSESTCLKLIRSSTAPPV